MNLRAISTSRYAAHPRAEPRAIFKNLAPSVLENLPFSSAMWSGMLVEARSNRSLAAAFALTSATRSPTHPQKAMLLDIRQGVHGRSKFSFFDHEHEQEPLIPFGPETTSLASSPKGY